ncbi:MAG TPA: hypothetical protein VLJ10_01405, partial [Candidatus Bathyarchaeia archaeon]|nr:hypothetical protein [Candidatus Bathyarchaeia archaeon]
MRALMIPLLLLCCLVLALMYVVVNTPYVLNKVLPSVINDHAKGFVLEEFHCAKQKGRLPDVVSLFDVTMKIRQGTRVYDIEADEIVIQNFFEFVKKQELLRLAARGIILKTENIDVQDGQFKAVIRLSDFKILFMETMAFAREFQFGPYLFSETSTHIKGNPSKIEIYEMKGSAYGGTVSGQLTFDQVPEFNYVLWSE